MNLLDYIIIIAMIYLVIKGIMRGFIREISSLAGIILGIWLGNLFHPQVAGFLRPYLSAVGNPLLIIISFGAIFACVVILCNLLGWAIKLLFKKALLGWFDRTLGALIAMGKGVIIAYVLIILLTFFIPSRTPLISESILAPWIIRSYQSIVSLISPDHYKKWKQKLLGEKEKIKGTISEKIKDDAEKH